MENNLQLLTSSQLALVNELKGGLFEFLVANELSEFFKLPSVILKSDVKKIDYLIALEDQMIKVTPELPLLLKKFAKELAFNIFQHFKHVDCQLSQIDLLGKHFENKKYHLGKEGEADLVVKDQNNNDYYLSIKLLKKGSSINTKSGGTKSFFINYFGSIEDCDLIQNNFNYFFAHHREIMIKEISSLSPPDFKINDILPSQLSDSQKKILYQFYDLVNKEMQHCLLQLKQNNLLIWRDGIKQLLGFSVDNVIQCISYYDQDQSRAFIIDHLNISNELNLMNVGDLVTTSGLCISSKLLQLMIRVKPMRYFAEKSYKINCSLRYDLSSL